LIDKKLLSKVTSLLKKQRLIIATAESCTGGLLAHTFTNVSGSSDYFDRGIVTYSNRAKIELLDIPDVLFKEHGAVSSEVAKAMANAIRTKSKVDMGIATTGIAGPTGGTKEKPVGLVYIAVSTSEKTEAEKFQFSGDRLQNKDITCNAALQMILNTLTIQ